MNVIYCALCIAGVNDPNYLNDPAVNSFFNQVRGIVKSPVAGFVSHGLAKNYYEAVILHNDFGQAFWKYQASKNSKFREMCLAPDPLHYLRSQIPLKCEKGQCNH